MGKRSKDEVTWLIWHLYVGGITDPLVLSRLVGEKLHGGSVKRLVAKVEQLVHGPLALAEDIRCKECGGRIDQIPCRTCGAPLLVSEGYKEISTVVK